jgi:hypothetical protein
LLAEIDRYADELAGMRASVAAADGPALLGQFALARDAREAWLRKIEGGR